MFIIELVPPSSIPQLRSYAEKIRNFLPSSKRFSIASKPSLAISGFEKASSLVRLLRDLQFQELEIIFHVTCRDLNRDNIEAKLHELHQLKIDKILVVTGDDYEATEIGTAGYESSLELLADVVKYAGHWLRWVAVGGYPGGNGRQSQDNASECERLSGKVELGANVILTQCVFNSGCYNEFDRMMRERHKHIKIIPSVVLFSSSSELSKAISVTRVNDLGSTSLSEQLKSLEDRDRIETHCREFSLKLCRDLTTSDSIILCTFNRLNLAQTLVEELNSSRGP